MQHTNVQGNSAPLTLLFKAEFGDSAKKVLLKCLFASEWLIGWSSSSSVQEPTGGANNSLLTNTIRETHLYM